MTVSSSLAHPLSEKGERLGKRNARHNIVVCEIGQFFDRASELPSYLRADNTGKIIHYIKILVELHCTYLNDFIDKSRCLFGISIIPLKVYYYILHKFTAALSFNAVKGIFISRCL